MFRALVCETGPADREGKIQIVARYLSLRRSGRLCAKTAPDQGLVAGLAIVLAVEVPAGSRQATATARQGDR